MCVIPSLFHLILESKNLKKSKELSLAVKQANKNLNKPIRDSKNLKCGINYSNIYEI